MIKRMAGDKVGYLTHTTNGARILARYRAEIPRIGPGAALTPQRRRIKA
jgi:hypothetical protein